MRLWITDVQLVTTHSPRDFDLSELFNDAFVTRGDAREVTEMCDELSDACREHFRNTSGQPTRSIGETIDGQYTLVQFIEWATADNDEDAGWHETWLVKYKPEANAEIPYGVCYVKPKKNNG